MFRKTALLAAPVVLVASVVGCSVFAPRPAPVERPPHVIIVGVDGLKPSDIDPARTPHLYLMQNDGAYTWDLQASSSGGRVGFYLDALTGIADAARAPRLPLTLAARCRAAGRPAMTLLRGRELAAIDPPARGMGEAADAHTSAADMGAIAAREFTRLRPACLFVELSAGSDKPEDCNAGVAHLLTAVRNAGLDGQTTLMLLSAGAPAALIVRGPDTRHGRQLEAPISVIDTFATAAWLLGLPPGDTLSRVAAEAFRAPSPQPAGRGERVLPRGSVHGRVLSADGAAMTGASVLLVRNEPPDGIAERWADTNALGEFRFDHIPAGTYDYVFVFDNLPARLRRSTLVKMKLAVPADEITRPTLSYRRISGAETADEVLPLTRTGAAFLGDGQLKTLIRMVTSGEFDPPLLAADALSGRRVRTSLIREWLNASASRLYLAVNGGAADGVVTAELADLAAAYDLNRMSGLLTEAEEQTVRIVIDRATQHILRKCYRGELASDASAHVAIGLASAAFYPSKQSRKWMSMADAMFERRLAELADAAEVRPAAIHRSELCSVLEYAMVNRAMGCGNYIGGQLKRLAHLAALCLTPTERRVRSAGRHAPLDEELGFLGLVRAAFAGRPLGAEAARLWRACGEPVWAPRGSRSVVPALLTAVAAEPPAPLTPAASQLATETTAILTKDWGTPGEWFVVLNGWNIDLHVGGAELARIGTRPVKGSAEYVPRIRRFISSPAYDYVLLAAWVNEAGGRQVAAYRHVLFNKMTGLLVVADEFPEGMTWATELNARTALPGGVLAGEYGTQAQVLALGSTGVVRETSIALQSASARPVFAIYAPPAGLKTGAARLGPWDVSRSPLAKGKDADPGGTHIILQTDHGTEFICLARTAATVEANLEDKLIEGTVAVIRCGTRSTDLMLPLATWAQSGELFFRLGYGHGYVTIEGTASASGWSDGPSRPVAVVLGEAAPRGLRLAIDGSPGRIDVRNGRADLWLPSGPHVFTIK